MKALFLDRDGVVIEYIPYLSKPEQVKIPDGAIEALKLWQDQGYRLVIVTNQSGISRGYFTYDDVMAIHQRILEEYGQFGVQFADILMCPHQPADNCHCRKPSPYLLETYSQHHHIDLARSYFIGDAPSDIECAINAQCQPVLVLTGRGEETKQHLSIVSQEIIDNDEGGQKAKGNRQQEFLKQSNYAFVKYNDAISIPIFDCLLETVKLIKGC